MEPVFLSVFLIFFFSFFFVLLFIMALIAALYHGAAFTFAPAIPGESIHRCALPSRTLGWNLGWGAINPNPNVAWTSLALARSGGAGRRSSRGGREGGRKPSQAKPRLLKSEEEAPDDDDDDDDDDDTRCVSIRSHVF